MIPRVLRSSRAWSLGKSDDFRELVTPDKRRLLMFVKICDDFFDVLVYVESSSYFCRYQFQRYAWYLEDVQEFLINNL